MNGSDARATSGRRTSLRSPLSSGLAGACHPVPTLAVTVFAVLLAARGGLPFSMVALLAAAVFSGQLSIGWSNDLLDANRDAASARRDKPAANGTVTRRALTTASGLALAATVALSLLLGWRAGLAALVLVAAGWAYNLGLKATPFSGLAYLVGFAALPVIPALASAGHPWPPWWAPVIAGLLGLSAHIANVLPDLDEDRAHGIRGLPHRLGPGRGVALMLLTLIAASLVIALGPAGARTPLEWAGIGATVLIAVLSGVLGIRDPRSGIAFHGALLVVLLDVLLFLLVR